MAPYIKTIDSHHLVSVGDEGFFCVPGAPPADYIEDCSTGVDNLAFAGAAGVDLLGFHLYPELSGQTVAWAETYITQHLSDAMAMGKPAYMGEYGLLGGNTRNAVYRDWTDLILNNGGSGALFWDLQPGVPSPLATEESSNLDLEAGSPILLTVGNFAQMMAANRPLSFPPVAGGQWATTPMNTPVTLNPAQNDVAYAGVTIDPATIRPDPATPGRLPSIPVYGGTFTVAGPAVELSPAAGFNGTAHGSYAIAGSNGTLSNPAYLFVTVPAAPADWAMLESFEAGTDGWVPLSPAAAVLTQSVTLHTDGNYGLQANVTNGGWFGAAFASPFDLSGRAYIAIDIETGSALGNSAIAFQSGSNPTFPF